MQVQGGALYSVLRTIAFGQMIERIMLRKHCLDHLLEYMDPAERNTL